MIGGKEARDTTLNLIDQLFYRKLILDIEQVASALWSQAILFMLHDGSLSHALTAREIKGSER